MDVIEYVEKLSGRKLTIYQKSILELLGSLPEGCCIVMGKRGPMILDGSGKRIDYVKEKKHE